MANENIKDKIKFYKVEDGDKTLFYADLLMQGFPLCLDFRDCPEEDAQKVLYFLQGVNYATDGFPTLMKKGVFLFATKKDLKDRDVINFIKEYQET